MKCPLACRNARFCVKAFEYPRLVAHLTTHKVPPMIWIMILIHRLSDEIGENKISWLGISSKVEGTVVSETQGEILEWSEECPPHATLNTVRNQETLNNPKACLVSLICRLSTRRPISCLSRCLTPGMTLHYWEVLTFFPASI